MTTNYKNWLIRFGIAFLGFVLLLLGPLFTFNYLIDPLWNFQTDNKWNQIQEPFNERQQKVNKLHFSDEKFDGILLGSSRGTYLNEDYFKGINVYNFSVSSMLPEEYKDYLEFAKKKNGGEFDYVFLGLDFFATNKTSKLAAEVPLFYIDQTESYLYRIKSTLSLDTLKKSFVSYQSSKNNEPSFVDHRYYDRHNHALPFPIDDLIRQQRIEGYLYGFYQGKEDYQYDPQFMNKLADLKQSNPHTTFIVFTTPETHPRLHVQLSMNELRLGYEQWLKDITDVFGTVYNFTDINSLTLAEKNFVDSHHFTPKSGNKMIDDIWNKKENKPAIATILKKETIEQQLSTVFNAIDKNQDTAYAFLKPVSGVAPVFEYSYVNASISSKPQMDKIIDSIAPLTLLGQRGIINANTDENGLTLHAGELSTKNPTSIRVGLTKNRLQLTNEDKVAVTLLITLKGNATPDTKTFLFVQEKINDEWKRKTYAPLPDEQASRTFKITVPVDSSSEEILTGFSWEPSVSNEWLTIEDIQIFTEPIK